MLREIQKFTGSFEYVFIGRNDPRQPIRDGAVAGMIKSLGYRGKQSMHGFRHLISTVLNDDGHDADWIERQLAHGDPDKMRGTYNKASYLEPRRAMMQQWADCLDKLKTTPAPTSVNYDKDMHTFSTSVVEEEPSSYSLFSCERIPSEATYTHGTSSDKSLRENDVRTSAFQLAQSEIDRLNVGH